MVISTGWLTCNKLMKRVTEKDTLVFLGDYIDRGAHSYEVIDFLISISRSPGFSSVFLKGNHEDMLMWYLRGEDRGGSYLLNGGDATIRSYIAHVGSLKLPGHHREFYDNLRLYYEGEDFIAVHAGLNPDIDTVAGQAEHDLLWIRDKFFRADKRWDKTVIFGHTPTRLIGSDSIYFDDERNIIGIDSGVIFGNPLSCLVWPEKKIITG
jgi:serine/threonine protein phosphatase 1